MAFADNLQYLMRTQQTTQNQLAQDSGCAVSCIWRLVNGHGQPRPSTVYALAKALHCKPEDLTGKEIPTHIRRWQPHHETCEQQLTEHLQSNIGPQSDMANNMAVIQRMQAKEVQPATLPVTDLQALFDACVDDNEPEVVFAQFGKQVYQLMAEAKKGE